MRQSRLGEATVIETRQVLGLPPLRLAVTEHQVDWQVAVVSQAIQAAEVVHADATELRVAGSQHWMHVLATMLLTWVAGHAKRGKQAFEALGILPGLLGILIHDGWKP